MPPPAPQKNKSFLSQCQGKKSLRLLLNLHALEKKKEQLKVTDELLHLQDALSLLVINSEDSEGPRAGP